MGLSKEKRKVIEGLRNPRLRARGGLFLVEGIRGVGEFLRATLPVKVRFALVSPGLQATAAGARLRGELDAASFPVEEVGGLELASLSDTEQSQGVLLVVEEPRGSWPFLRPEGRLRILLLDGLQDPGNVGTLIRTARAFGLNGVLALEGTADPWNAKAVRGGAGAAAHIPVASAIWEEARAWLLEQGVPVYAADAGGDDVRGLQRPESWALVLGNEGAGVRREIKEAAEGAVSIPMEGGVDSLNVAMAGAILLYALSQTSTPKGRA